MENAVAFDSHQQDHHAKQNPDRATAEMIEIFRPTWAAQAKLGEVAERLPLVAFGPQGGPSREKPEINALLVYVLRSAMVARLERFL